MTTAHEAYAALRRHGASVADATVLTAIGGAESGWNLTAVGDVGLETAKWGPSYGIWQIRTLKAETGKGTTRDINQLRTGIDAQAAAALTIRDGQGLHAWSTYTSGSYAGYLGQAKTAARAKADSMPATTTPAAAVTRTGVDPGPNATNVGLFPGGNLDPLNWPGAILGGAAGAAAGAAGDAAGVVAQGLWSEVQPFLITSMFALGGIALVLIGLQVAARPAVEKASQDAGQVAGLAAMAA